MKTSSSRIISVSDNVQEVASKKKSCLLSQSLRRMCNVEALVTVITVILPRNQQQQPTTHYSHLWSLLTLTVSLFDFLVHSSDGRSMGPVDQTWRVLTIPSSSTNTQHAWKMKNENMNPHMTSTLLLKRRWSPLYVAEAHGIHQPFSLFSLMVY